jgi:hypothetical protein
MRECMRVPITGATVEFDFAFDLLKDHQRRADWGARLTSCRTRSEVMGLVNEFVETRSAEIWARLPDSCRPGPMRISEDVSAYAVTLVAKEFGLEGAAAADLYDLTSFFTAASHRLVQLSLPDTGLGRFFN